MTANREPEGSPVTAVRRSSRGPSASIVFVAVVAVLAVAIGIAVVSGRGPSPSAAPVAVVSASPSAQVSLATPVASASLDVTPGPAPTSTVLVLRGVADPAGVLGAMTGCPLLHRTTGRPAPVVSGTAVDAVATNAGRDTGWLYVPPGIQGTTKVWLGDDVVKLALTAGAPAVAVGVNGPVWLGGPAGATRWQSIATPAGRTAWVMTNDEITGHGKCGPWTMPTMVNEQRSLTCAGIGFPACLDDDVLVAGWTTAGSDVVVVGDPCGSGCGDVAVWLAAGTASPGGIVGGATVRVGTPLHMPEPAQQLPDAVLDAIGRPALPLPTVGRTGRAPDCTESIVGELHGSPWDPRVAWIGTMAISWPTGSTARFTPGLELNTGGWSILQAGEAVVAMGSLDAAGDVFAACSLGPAPSSGASPSPAP